MKVEQTECSETSAHKIQTPGNYPEESIKQMDAVKLRQGKVPGSPTEFYLLRDYSTYAQ